MKERPILFNGTMVRAILNGSKTQTRRLAKGAIARHVLTGEALSALDSAGPRVVCPYGRAGDRLWVRETFVQGYDVDPVTDRLIMTDVAGNEVPKRTWYRATDDITWADDDGWETNVPWRPSIHMPRADSRIDLLIRSVRVERLQDINEADAKSEGADCLIMDNCTQAERTLLDMPLMENGSPYRNGFALLWEASYGAGSWAANPWVWVVSFERVKP